MTQPVVLWIWPVQGDGVTMANRAHAFLEGTTKSICGGWAPWAGQPDTFPVVARCKACQRFVSLIGMGS